MAAFSDLVVPANLNMRDPDTMQYPIFVDFDALVIWCLNLSTVNEVTMPLTVFGYFELILSDILQTGRVVHVLVTSAYERAWSCATATSRLLRKLLRDHLDIMNIGIHLVFKFDEIAALIDAFLPLVYVTVDPSVSLWSLQPCLFHLECAFLAKQVSILTLDQVDGQMSMVVPVVELKPGSATKMNELLASASRVWLDESNYAVSEKSFVDFDVILETVSNELAKNNSLVNAWNSHRRLMKVVSLRQRGLILTRNIKSGFVLERVSTVLLENLENITYDTREFIDLYDPRLLEIAVNHPAIVERILKNSDQEIVNDCPDLPPFLPRTGFLVDLQKAGIAIEPIKDVSTSSGSFDAYYPINLSNRHWHNHKLIEEDSLPKTLPKYALKNLQKEANYNQKFSDTFKSKVVSERRLILNQFDVNNLPLPLESKATRKPKNAKVSKSAMVKAAIKQSNELKKDLAIDKDAERIFNLANQQKHLKGTAYFLENELKKFKDSSLSKLEIQLYIRLCETWSQIWNQSRSDIDKRAWFAAVRDLWRFYGDSCGVKDQLVKYFEEMDFEILAKKLVGKKCKGNDKSIEFQLDQCSDLLLRKTDSVLDNRVSKNFIPDKWQVEMLDAVDKHHSLLVSAPTSSGKTFVSYYCISQIINSPDKRIVFVVPTKSLVNQVRADIYARYGPIYGVFTRDERSQNVMTAKILITVPQILEILLLSPESQKWAQSLHYGILDEIHSIADPENGSAWERILAMIPCPVVCLSATIGNLENFGNWLNVLQDRKGHKLVVVERKNRWNDLGIQIYAPKATSLYRPGSVHWQIDSVQKNPPAETNLYDIHPFGYLSTTAGWTGYKNSNRKLNHIKLTPKQGLDVFKALKSMEKTLKSSIASVDPQNYFAGTTFLDRDQVDEWMNTLKDFLTEKLSRDEIYKLFCALDAKIEDMNSKELHFFNLLLELDSQDQLPAIAFVLDREGCERLALYCVEQIRAADRKSTEECPREMKKAEKLKMAKQMIETNDDDEVIEVEIETTMIPNSFAKKTSIEPNNFWLQRLYKKTNWINNPAFKWIFDALNFGIGVHHSGMPKAYRDCVEALFRDGKLRVIISTGTLAMGINMPCRTTIICESSRFLSPLLYQQMSGRAGRRGFDTRGNVVFFNVSRDRIGTLLCSPLPTLAGAFPVSTTTILRMLVLYDSLETNRNQVLQSLSILLENSLLSATGGINPDLLKHHLSISLELFKAIGLVDNSFILVQSSGLNVLERLHYHEPSNFILFLLFNSQVLQDHIESIPNSQEAAECLFEIFCHLFNRIPLPSQYVKLPGAREIRLKPLPDPIKDVFNDWNTLINDRLGMYVMKKSNLIQPELSLTKYSLDHFSNGENPCFTENIKGIGEIVEYKIQHPFFGLRGLPDGECNPRDFVASVRLPVFSSTLAELNNYAFEFFKHGSFKTVKAENMLKDSQCWALLKDWCLILSAIRQCIAPSETKFYITLVAVIDQMNEKFHNIE